MRSLGVESAELEQILAAVKVELVFTAHPTEAKRKSVRAKLREIRRLLSELDDPTPLPRERQELRQALKFEIAKSLANRFCATHASHRAGRSRSRTLVPTGPTPNGAHRAERSARCCEAALSGCRTATGAHAVVRFVDGRRSRWPSARHARDHRGDVPLVAPFGDRGQLDRVSQMLNSLSMSARHAPNLARSPPRLTPPQRAGRSAANALRRFLCQKRRVAG